MGATVCRDLRRWREGVAAAGSSWSGVSQMATLAPPGLREAFRAELTGSILPFWMNLAIDREHGGFHGAITNDLRIQDDVPRSSVLHGRLLWTFSAANRVLGVGGLLATADHARSYLLHRFWDPDRGGVYWSVDRRGEPVQDRKHTYAQAFAIYGLVEHHLAAGDAESLRLAQQLYALIEAHANDPVHGGYVESRDRAWGPLADMRLSAKEPHCWKSMNTHLHVLEAYTSLFRAWPDAALRRQLRALVDLFLERIYDPEGGRFRLFFDEAWHRLPDHVSPGHDVEGSWLLVEAARALGDAELQARVERVAVRMAAQVLAEGRDGDGTVLHALGTGGADRERHWWVQAEAIVGFTNAHQLSGDGRFAEAALACWDYVQRHFVDRRHGEWFKVLRPDGTPVPGQVKAGPWECPYHHARMCLEMMVRLG
jgi:mannobiose 2-epimerase